MVSGACPTHPAGRSRNLTGIPDSSSTSCDGSQFDDYQPAFRTLYMRIPRNPSSPSSVDAISSADVYHPADGEVIGVAVDGVPIIAGSRSSYVSFLDSCAGYASGANAYSYPTVPSCLVEQVCFCIC